MAKVSRENCEIGQTFYVRIPDRRARPEGPTRVVRVRRNGKTQTWKTRPNHFRIPCKYGLYEYLNITHDSDQTFFTEESEA